MELIQQLGTVAAVLAVLAGSLWWLRRRGLVSGPPRRGAGRLLQARERLALGPHHAVHLLRLGERALVVGSGPSSCTLLADCAWRDVETVRGTEPREMA